jgi:nucleoside-diphosphate-sugar epimerase
MAALRILVVGAIGKQGSAVIDALLSHSQTHTFHILALTRTPDSPRAKRLAQNALIEIVAGDPTSASASAIFASVAPIDAVFCITVHGKPGAEEAQAAGLIDASVAHGVKYFVFSSADRGGEDVSDVTPTNVPHIASKYHIEEYLKKAAAGTQMTWTMLRPVTFMENLTPDFAGKGFAAMWNQVGERPVQLVAVSDVGFFCGEGVVGAGEVGGEEGGDCGG